MDRSFALATEDLAGFVAFVDELAAADAFSGTILVAIGGLPVLERAWGLASKGYGVPNHVDTRFNLGSMNKMFTAVAIAQLVEAGRLAFESPVADYLPDYPGDVARRITIHQLLTHTSGLGSFWNERFEATRTRVRTVSDYLALSVDEPLLFDPGERFEYSNSGFIVLGAVIEAVSGQDYFSYVRDHIYAPAGMRDTDAYETDADVPNLATGYTRMPAIGPPPGGPPREGPRRSNIHIVPVKGGPAGGGYSTVGDLLRFGEALRGHRLLSPTGTATLLEGKVEMEGLPGSWYGYGFTVQEQGTVVGHGGGAPGIGAKLDIYLDRPLLTAMLTNYDPWDMQPVAERLRRLCGSPGGTTGG
jgi:CubicO group peptidase (beta-lactamase class C family)